MSHLTRGDRHFLASIEASNLRKLDDLVDLTDELIDEADLAGIEADLEALEMLADDDLADDPELLDALRGHLHAQLGQIRRGEHLSPDTTDTDTDTDTTEETETADDV
jgi:hypothetical protein